MDKAILKKFAIESRQELMQKMESKIKTFYIDEDFSEKQSGDLYILSNNKHTLSLTKEEYDKREILIKRVKELGIEQVIEESAYTWFNRIVAIRYMEINDYLPLTKDNQSLGIRVLSSKDNTNDPEILKFTNLFNPDLDISFKKEKYTELKTDNDKFKYILLLVCKKLGKVIPQVFSGVTDYIDILILDNLLNDTGFIAKIVKEIPEDNYNQVEIIGWLYQYYISEKKNNLDKELKAGKKAQKNDIPIKTQIFTPKEIVRFMISNALCNNKSIDKKVNSNGLLNVKIYDPCCGSGHILICAYEELYKLYEELGYSSENISKNIIENNIYGTDIDERAVQLAILAVFLRARADDKKLFFKVLKINILEIQESNSFDDSSLELLTSENSLSKELLYKISENFYDAKIFGSLINVEVEDYEKIIETIQKLKKRNLNIFELEKFNNIENKYLALVNQAIIMSQKYDVVVTNPPYLGRKNCDTKLCEFLDKNYVDGKMDMFSAFIKKNINYCLQNGKIALMTPDTWLYLSSYKLLRKYIVGNTTFEKILQPYDGYFNDAAVSICAFILTKKVNNGSVEKFKLNTDGTINLTSSITIEKLKKIPDYRFVFDVSDRVIGIYENDCLETVCKPRQGMATTNNDLFLRKWFEVALNKIGFNYSDEKEAFISELKWFPYNKGGGNRKWYGNNEYVVNFENKGKTIADYIDNSSKSRVKSNGRIINREYFFKKSITWSDICGKTFSARACNKGFIFDVKGSSGFVSEEKYLYILALLNSYVSVKLLNILNPTITTQVGDIKQIPFIYNGEKLSDIEKLASENIEISKEDWDSFETSWDFIKHPLIEYKDGAGYELDISEWNYKIKYAFESWKYSSNEKFEIFKQNEEKLNRIFIEIYELQDELTPEVEEKDVAIRKADRIRDVKSLISYAVGCMFGRYSLDEEGLVYADGEFDINKYKTFKVDNDNIITITDESYFNDDIVARFKKFVEVVYGRETLNENLDYIAESIGQRETETSEETIRRYFLNDFYNDHIKTYQKRPIYWLFDSGKKNGFKALIYMHRYNENTVPKVRLDYLHRIQTTYEKLLTDVNYKLTTELTMTDKKQVQNRQADLNAKLVEIKEYDEKIAHIANQRISIDLDDGIKINYEKFADILAKIK